MAYCVAVCFRHGGNLNDFDKARKQSAPSLSTRAFHSAPHSCHFLRCQAQPTHKHQVRCCEGGSLAATLLRGNK